MGNYNDSLMSILGLMRPDLFTPQDDPMRSGMVNLPAEPTSVSEVVRSPGTPPPPDWSQRHPGWSNFLTSVAQGFASKLAPEAFAQSQQSTRQSQELRMRMAMEKQKAMQEALQHQQTNAYQNAMLKMQEEAQKRLREEDQFRRILDTYKATDQPVQILQAGQVTQPRTMDPEFQNIQLAPEMRFDPSKEPGVSALPGVPGMFIKSQAPPKYKITKDSPLAQLFPGMESMDLTDRTMPFAQLDLKAKEAAIGKMTPDQLKAHGESVKAQVANMIGKSNPDLYKGYSYRVDEAIARNDPKSIADVIADAQKFKEEGAKADMELKRKYSDEALRGEAKVTAQRVRIEEKVRADQAYENNKNAYPGIYNQIISGALTLSQAYSNFDKYAREGFNKWFVENNKSLPVPLNDDSLKVLKMTGPVLHDLDVIENELKPYINSDQPATFLKSRILYALGKTDENTGLVSKAELERITGAALRVRNASKTIQALNKAEIHLPNIWKDSPKMIMEKIRSVRDNFYSMEQAAVDFGAKTGVVDTSKIGNARRGITPQIPSDKELLDALRQIGGKK